MKLALLTLALVPPAAVQGLEVQLVTSGFAQPVALTTPPADNERLFVVEQNTGLIRIVEDDQILPTPFLDLGALIEPFGERGLLGLAFHPDYANNGRFFVNYTRAGDGATRVVEYGISAGNPDVADPVPVQTIFALDQPGANHNGGCIAFGADGMLYVGTGDGGAGGSGRAQDPQLLYGKMLRFDVDAPPPFTPADNPFVGDGTTLDEIWALGLRNPWRFGFDPLTGDLWIGDVGAQNWEEIDFQPGTSTGAENYGWRCMEGNACTGLSGCTCNSPELTLPIHDYGHDLGCAVTGGHVWRDWRIPELYGLYFFADFCSGRIWTLRQENGVLVDLKDRSAELGGPVGNVSAFGQDPSGSVYIVDFGGSVWRIAKSCGAETYCDALPNSTGVHATIELTGSASLGAPPFGLLARDLPPGQFLYFLVSAEAGFIPLPGGSTGNLCLTGNDIGRFVAQIGVASGAGEYGITVDVGGLPVNPPTAILPGDTWFFQAWYRDLNPTPQTNFTEALSVKFCP